MSMAADMRPVSSTSLLLPKKFLVLVPTALLIIAALVSGCKKEQKKAAAAPPEVEVTQVLQKDVDVKSEWIGTTDGSENAAIQAQVEGYIVRQAYKEGQLGKKRPAPVRDRPADIPGCCTAGEGRPRPETGFVGHGETEPRAHQAPCRAECREQERP